MPEKAVPALRVWNRTFCFTVFRTEQDVRARWETKRLSFAWIWTSNLKIVTAIIPWSFGQLAQKKGAHQKKQEHNNNNNTTLQAEKADMIRIVSEHNKKCPYLLFTLFEQTPIVQPLKYNKSNNAFKHHTMQSIVFSYNLFIDCMIIHTLFCFQEEEVLIFLGI
jgi:hypothetical protein